MSKRQGDSVDASASGALDGLVRIALRCGVSRAEILRAVGTAVRRSRQPARKAAAGSDPELRLASHVMTVWYDDPRYLSEEGEPKPLSRAAFSALVDEAAPELNSNELLRYLMRTCNVRRSGTKYAAIRPEVILRGIPGPWDARMVRTVDAMLRTANHNAVPGAPPWIERTAENDWFPVNRLEDLTDFLERETTGYLRRIDAFLRSKEVERMPGEPTVSVTVGVYRSERDSVAQTRDRRRPRNPSPGRSRRRGRPS